MNDELIALLEYWEKEKGISKETMMDAIKQGLLSAAKRSVGPARELRVEVDPRDLEPRPRQLHGQRQPDVAEPGYSDRRAPVSQARPQRLERRALRHRRAIIDGGLQGDKEARSPRKLAHSSRTGARTTATPCAAQAVSRRRSGPGGIRREGSTSWCSPGPG